MNKPHRIAHVIASIGLAAHVAAHVAGEAWHEAILEIAISPVMHFVEHHVGQAEAAAGIIEEHKPEAPVPAPIDPRFRAHHRDAR